MTDGVLAGIHLAIYGEGNAILKKFEYIETVGEVPDDRYRYFGDIDWEGISIYNRLRTRYPEYDIRPATALYAFILQKAGPAGARPLRRPEEESPMGLILYAGKSAEHIELLQLGRSGIRVAEYLTELPPGAVLEERLKAAISVARKQLEMRYDIDAMESPKMGDE